MKFTNELRGVKSRLLLFSVLLLIPVMMFAQSITVKGTVLDSAGEAVIGASVVEKGNPSNGTITDFDGKFTLAVSKGKRIVISFVGYETQEVDAVTGKELTITLQDDSQALEEVVVLGYSSRARKDLTGSVGSVSGVKIAAVPVTSAAVALQGKIEEAGVETVLKNNIQSATMAGFGTTGQAVELFIQETDFAKANPVIEEFRLSI